MGRQKAAVLCSMRSLGHRLSLETDGQNYTFVRFCIVSVRLGSVFRTGRILQEQYLVGVTTPRSTLGSTGLHGFSARQVVKDDTYAQRQQQDADGNDDADGKLF